jgi:hypothetical protein
MLGSEGQSRMLSEHFVSPSAVWKHKDKNLQAYGPGIYPSFRKLQRLEIQLAKTLHHINFLMRCKSQDIYHPQRLLCKDSLQ